VYFLVVGRVPSILEMKKRLKGLPIQNFSDSRIFNQPQTPTDPTPNTLLMIYDL